MPASSRIRGPREVPTAFRRWLVAPFHASARRRREARIVRQDGRLELSQRATRLQPQVLGQPLVALAVDGERLGLPVAPVQRQHELSAEPLPQRVIRDERLELTHDLGVAAELEVGVDPRLDRGHAQLLEPGDLRLRERLVREVRQRPAAPQRQGVAQVQGRLLRRAAVERPAALREVAFEAVAIELARRDAERVAVAPREQRP
jgi:hypothetical protein